MPLSRRNFLTTSLAGLAACAQPDRNEQAVAAPLRVITKGPKHHWFSYYDKLQFDPSNRRVLCMEVDFEHRTPTVEDTIRLGVVDLGDNDRWIDLDQSNAWGWQQGCMLQWLPGSQSEIIWNDRQDGEYVSRILDVESGKKRTAPHPVYSVSPDGKTRSRLIFGAFRMCGRVTGTWARLIRLRMIWLRMIPASFASTSRQASRS